MNKKYLIIIILFLAFFSYFGIRYYENYKILKIITTDISKKGRINFNEINFFDWDGLLILGPYSVIEITEKKINIDLSTADNSIQSHDDINTLIFFKNKKLVKQVNLSREFGDFSNSGRVIPKDSASFILKRLEMTHYKGTYIKTFEQDVK